MEEEKKEKKKEDCCEHEKCDCEKVKKFLPQTIVLVLLIVGAGAFGYYKLIWSKNNLTQAQAKAKAEGFINETLMKGQPDGMKANISEIAKENGMFKMKVVLGEGDEKQEIDSYLSLDGAKFIPDGSPRGVMDIAEVEKQATEKPVAQEKEPDAEIPKSDKPKVDIYVMSFCPYGNKAEDTLKDAYALLKNKVDFNFHYIVSSKHNVINSLHGEKEVVQNKREACVLKNYGKDKWVDFVTYVNTNCGNDGTCWEAGAKSLAINVTKITTCVNKDGVALMKADEKVSNTVGATGSPTMFINGVKTSVVYKYGNPEEYKKVICSAFNKEPAECAKTLSTSAPVADGGSCN